MNDLPATSQRARLLGDPTRLRLLNALSVDALTVAELTRVTALGQSRVSTHLGKLRDAGLLTTRSVGSATLYALDLDGMPPATARWWRFVQAEVHDPLFATERARVAEVVRERTGSSWADSLAGRMARHYSPGRTWPAFARGIVGLVRLGRVIDIASGDGALAEMLAPRAERVTCVDCSARVVQTGAQRLAHLPNLRFVQGDMHALPIADASQDAALLLGALCYATDPARVIAEAARALVPGGLLVAVTLEAHPHAEAVARYDHVQQGFRVADLEAMLRAAGLVVDLCAVTERERRAPHFNVITLHARRST